MNIGLLGFGVVGKGVYEIIASRPDMQISKILCLEEISLKDAQAASAEWIDASGTSDRPEAVALRQRIGELFTRAEGTMN